MSENTQLFELQLEAAADVVRGCCGREHEFGPCPHAGAQADQVAGEDEPDAGGDS